MRHLRSVLLSFTLTLYPFALSGSPARDPEIERIVAEISPTAIEATIRKLVSFHTRHTLSASDKNEGQGIRAAREWIKSEFERYSKDSGSRLQVAFDPFLQPPTPPRVFQETEIVNVVATLPGRQPESQDRIYVVSGHYDTRSLNPLTADSEAPGANDDGSGTAAVLEMARVMSKREFNATIIFMTVAAEEQGLLGARHWAEQAKAKKLAIAGMFTNDIIGSPKSDQGVVDDHTVRLFAEGVPPLKSLSDEVITQLRTGGENDFPTRELARAVKSVAELYVPQMNVRVIYRRDRFLRSGDHSPFLDAGFAALRFTEPAENYAHQHQDVRVENGKQYGDLPEYVDFNYLANVARINAASLANLAQAPAAPRDVEVETTRLENDTSLRWSANPEPTLAGYRIVWRESTAPFWEHTIDVGNVLHFTVTGLSKDNVIFGVQAVDQAGHVSPAVYPRPFRNSETPTKK